MFHFLLALPGTGDNEKWKPDNERWKPMKATKYRVVAHRRQANILVKAYGAVARWFVKVVTHRVEK